MIFSVEEILDRATEIEKMPGRSNTTANIIRAYRDLTGASLKEAIEWMKVLLVLFHTMKQQIK
jgi:ribosomal protein L7/L12